MPGEVIRLQPGKEFGLESGRVEELEQIWMLEKNPEANDKDQSAVAERGAGKPDFRLLQGSGRSG